MTTPAGGADHVLPHLGIHVAGAPTGAADHVLLHLGAYVLGGLCPDEAIAVTGHLAACVECQQEADRLMEVRGWLDQLSPEDLQILADQSDPDA
jgi:hypothetical protein